MLDIIYEDDDMIVCHKPSGIAVQTRRIGQPDMESELKNYRVSKGESPYIGIVHRLDQPVEGLLVFAKNQASAANLSRQVAARQFTKCYYALVHVSQPPNSEETEWVTLTDYMGKDGRTNMARIVPENVPGAKRAVLEYHVLNCRDGLALLDIHLHTGRHHQIRVQMAHAGMQLVGDRKYGADKNASGKDASGKDASGKNAIVKAATGNLLLCAYRLEFTHPSSGEKVSFAIMPEWAAGKVLSFEQE